MIKRLILSAALVAASYTSAHSMIDPYVATPEEFAQGCDPIGHQDTYNMLPTESFSAGMFVFNVSDLPGEGFNDPILGSQRIAAMTAAADLLSLGLTWVVPVEITLGMQPRGLGNLASAGTAGSLADFPSAPLPGVWYPGSLVNQLEGSDQSPGSAEIVINFNSARDTDPSVSGWYYGTDALPPTQPGATRADIDFITVAIHELCHGLGITTRMQRCTTGPNCARFSGGSPDAWIYNTLDATTNLFWWQESIPARRASGASDPTMLYVGPATAAVAPMFTAGYVGPHMMINTTGGSGSKWVHPSPQLDPFELMEPFYQSATHDTSLVTAILEDLGWNNGFTPPTTLFAPPLPTTTTTTLTAPLPPNIHNLRCGCTDGFIDVSKCGNCADVITFCADVCLTHGGLNRQTCFTRSLLCNPSGTTTTTMPLPPGTGTVICLCLDGTNQGDCVDCDLITNSQACSTLCSGHGSTFAQTKCTLNDPVCNPVTTTTIATTTTVTTTTVVTTTTSTTTTLPGPTCGDANGDGRTNVIDGLAIMRAAIGLDTCSVSLCDVNTDGAVLVSDTLALLRFIVSGSPVPKCPTQVVFSLPAGLTVGAVEFTATGNYSGSGFDVACTTGAQFSAVFNGTSLSVALVYNPGATTPLDVLTCDTDSALADITVSGVTVADPSGRILATSVETRAQ